MTTVHTRNLVHFGSGTTDIAGLAAEATARLRAPELAARRTIFAVRTMREAIGCAAFGIIEGLDFGLIGHDRLSSEIVGHIAEHGAQLVDAASGTRIGTTVAPSDTGVGASVEPGRVTVLTSGTTGLLKLIAHTPRTLDTFGRVRDLPPNTWFLPYQIGSYAWYQMVALALFQPGQDLVPGDANDLTGSFEAALREGRVTAISSTPTFWRLALMAIDESILTGARLRSLSLGGEIVDQPILDRLRTLYPAARIRHIYASSEAGAAIVVSDGKAGFDATLLDREDGIIGIMVEEGRLFVRSPYTSHVGASGWVDTGDLVERRGDRFHFLGRAGHAMINVGGQKAFAPDIEAHLMTHPDVVWARVSARKAPLMGALPVAEIVLAREMDPDEAERMLTAHCEGHLADYAVPRMWTFHASIPMRASLKS